MSITVFAEGTPIPAPGEKIIAEFIGNVSSKTEQLSVAHMIAPSGWAEDSHSTKFDEIVIVVRGTLTVATEKAAHKIPKGQVGWIEPAKSITFSNQATETCEYWAVCFPAFSPDLVDFPNPEQP